jgi:thiamine pyrophosphokinase
MQKALIITGGKAPKKEEYSHELLDTDLIIAADSGYDTAVQQGLAVDVLIGDMDSIMVRPGNSMTLLQYPTEKDHTDTELALDYIKNTYNPVETVLIGGGEGRLDHTLSVVNTFRQHFRPIRWYTSYECVYYVDASLRLTGLRKCHTIAVMGLSDRTATVSSKGLKWELAEHSISNSIQSISNQNVSECVEIEVLDGIGVLVSVTY